MMRHRLHPLYCSLCMDVICILFIMRICAEGRKDSMAINITKSRVPELNILQIIIIIIIIERVKESRGVDLKETGAVIDAMSFLSNPSLRLLCREPLFVLLPPLSWFCILSSSYLSTLFAKPLSTCLNFLNRIEIFFSFHFHFYTFIVIIVLLL